MEIPPQKYMYLPLQKWTRNVKEIFAYLRGVFLNIVFMFQTSIGFFRKNNLKLTLHVLIQEAISVVELSWKK